jgi:branched-chain amino acid transport system ATP-binding protein
MSMLVVKGIEKSYGANRAVNGISFALERGEMLALIGPNGAGKSTTFNMLNGQIRPDRGEIEFNSKSILGWSARQTWRAGIGRTFQVAQTFGSLSLAQNVQMALLSSHEKLFSFWQSAKDYQREQALELLRRVDLHTQADKTCANLAYGDVKRLELAIALASEPMLLLMDEPTAGMSQRERQTLMALTHQLVKDKGHSDKGLCVLFTEHNMDVVFEHADRVLVMAQGELIAQGPPQEIKENALVQSVYLGGGHLTREKAW